MIYREFDYGQRQPAFLKLFSENRTHSYAQVTLKCLQNMLALLDDMQFPN